jgi:hypothetical protein
MSYTKTQIGNEMADGTVKAVFTSAVKRTGTLELVLRHCLRSVGYH